MSLPRHHPETLEDLMAEVILISSTSETSITRTPYTGMRINDMTRPAREIMQTAYWALFGSAVPVTRLRLGETVTIRTVPDLTLASGTSVAYSSLYNTTETVARQRTAR